MLAVIEQYRSFEIKFDANDEKFVCELGESKSYSSCKKLIDEHTKKQQAFKPFPVIANPEKTSYAKKGIITGIRKDGRFVIEVDGKSEQLSTYKEPDYILDVVENTDALLALKDIEEELSAFTANYRKRKKAIIENLNIITLETFKKTLNLLN